MKKIKLIAPIIGITGLSASIVPIVACTPDSSENVVKLIDSPDVKIDKTTYKLNEDFEAILWTDIEDCVVSNELTITIGGKTLGTQDYTTQYVPDSKTEGKYDLRLTIRAKFITDSELTIQTGIVANVPKIKPAADKIYEGVTEPTTFGDDWKQTVTITGFVWENLTAATKKSLLSPQVTALGMNNIQSRIIFTGANTFDVEAYVTGGYFYSGEDCKLNISFFYNGKIVEDFGQVTYTAKFDTKITDLTDYNFKFDMDENGNFVGSTTGKFYVINPSAKNLETTPVFGTTSLEISDWGEIPSSYQSSSYITVSQKPHVAPYEELDNFEIRPIFTLTPSLLEATDFDFKTYNIKITATHTDVNGEVAATKEMNCRLVLEPKYVAMQSGTKEEPRYPYYYDNGSIDFDTNTSRFIGYKNLEVSVGGFEAFKIEDSSLTRVWPTATAELASYYGSNYRYYLTITTGTGTTPEAGLYVCGFSIMISYDKSGTTVYEQIDSPTIYFAIVY